MSPDSTNKYSKLRNNLLLVITFFVVTTIGISYYLIDELHQSKGVPVESANDKPKEIPEANELDDSGTSYATSLIAKDSVPKVTQAPESPLGFNNSTNGGGLGDHLVRQLALAGHQNIALVKKTFSSERRNSAWATTTESEIYTHLYDLYDNNQINFESFGNVECKSTVCRTSLITKAENSETENSDVFHSLLEGLRRPKNLSTSTGAFSMSNFLLKNKDSHSIDIYFYSD